MENQQSLRPLSITPTSTPGRSRAPRPLSLARPLSSSSSAYEPTYTVSDSQILNEHTVMSGYVAVPKSPVAEKQKKDKKRSKVLALGRLVVKEVLGGGGNNVTVGVEEEVVRKGKEKTFHTYGRGGAARPKYKNALLEPPTSANDAHLRKTLTPRSAPHLPTAPASAPAHSRHFDTQRGYPPAPPSEASVSVVSGPSLSVVSAPGWYHRNAPQHRDHVYPYQPAHHARSTATLTTRRESLQSGPLSSASSSSIQTPHTAYIVPLPPPNEERRRKRRSLSFDGELVGVTGVGVRRQPSTSERPYVGTYNCPPEVVIDHGTPAPQFTRPAPPVPRPPPNRRPTTELEDETDVDETILSQSHTVVGFPTTMSSDSFAFDTREGGFVVGRGKVDHPPPSYPLPTIGQVMQQQQPPRHVPQRPSVPQLPSLMGPTAPITQNPLLGLLPQTLPPPTAAAIQQQQLLALFAASGGLPALQQPQIPVVPQLSLPQLPVQQPPQLQQALELYLALANVNLALTAEQMRFGSGPNPGAE